MNLCNYDGWLSLAGFLLACFKKREEFEVPFFDF